MKTIAPLRGRARVLAWIVLGLALTALVLTVASAFAGRNKPHTAAEFGVSDPVSRCDGDGDGVEDHADLVAGAEKYLSENGPDAAADGERLLVSAFGQAGYDLPALITADADAAPEAYDGVSAGLPALRVWLTRNAAALPVETYTPGDWGAGDLAFFDGKAAVCAYERGASGIPLLICADGSRLCAASVIVTDHFRFN